MWLDHAAVEFLQPNFAERQDYTGTVGTEREPAKKNFIVKKFHKDNFYNSRRHCKRCDYLSFLSFVKNL